MPWRAHWWTKRSPKPYSLVGLKVIDQPAGALRWRDLDYDQYWVCISAPDGDTSIYTVFEADDDAEVINMAFAKVYGFDGEIWHQNRFVVRLPALANEG